MDLKKKKLLQHISGNGFSGPGYISRLTSKISTGSQVEQHCYILKEKEAARKYLDLGHRLINNSNDPGFDIHKANDFALDEVSKILNVVSVKKVIDNVDLAQEMKRNIEMASEMGGITGVPTGFSEYDRLTGGRNRICTVFVHGV